jgi:NADH-quinone oxidoreductase subunit L
MYLQYSLLLIPLFPLVSAFFLLFIKTEKTIGKISTNFTFASFIVSAALLIFQGKIYPHPFNFSLFDFMPDKLGLLLSTYILLVCLVVHKYSQNYMKDDQGHKRFFFLMDLMTADLVALVLSGNLLLFFGAWHVMGVLLYLMLNHNYKNKAALKFSSITFFTQRLADLPLLAAVIILYKDFHTFKISIISQEILKGGNLSHDHLAAAAVFVVLSALLKSAQFPFHISLIYSMDGPTPLSALMHAGIVNAGAFLVNRFYFVFTNPSLALQAAFLVGSLTAVIGSMLMLTQNDIKKSLGYSTMGQMGYMTMEIGVGNFPLAIYHMISHGIFKATMFLYSGNVIHKTRKRPNLPADSLYSSLAKDQEPSPKSPFVFFGVLSVLLPLALVAAAHFLVNKNFIEYKTSLILLFFGWVTAAQVILSVSKIEKINPIKAVIISVLSLGAFLLGYALFSHYLALFLYPQKYVMQKIYQNAFSSNIIFGIEVLIFAVIVSLGWFFIYNSSQNRYIDVRVSFYTHLSREFYILDFYQSIKSVFLKFSRQLSEINAASVSAAVFSVSAFLAAILFLNRAPLNLFSIFLLAASGFLIPLFPMSLFSSKILSKANLWFYTAFPILGFFLLKEVKTPFSSWLFIFSTAGFVLHSIKIFSCRNMNAAASELYAALFNLVWAGSLAEQHPYALLILSIPPLAFKFVDRLLVKLFGNSEFVYIKGLYEEMPVFSWMLTAFALFSYIMPLFPPFMLFYRILSISSKWREFFLLIGWFCLSLGVMSKIMNLIGGKRREDLYYQDFQVL